MENTREGLHRGDEQRVGVDRHREMETQQLLPLTSMAHPEANSDRSHRASISNVSVASSVEPGGKRK